MQSGCIKGIQSLLAIPCAIGDIVDGSVRLRLSSTVVGIRPSVALGEKRAGQLGASVLPVDIVVGV